VTAPAKQAEGRTMCATGSNAISDGLDEEGRYKLDRRTLIFGAACFAMGATIPGTGQAAGLATAGERAAGSGRPRQSPIDLRARDITFVDRLPRIEFEYPRGVDVTLVNTGSPDEFATVRADVPAGAAHLTLKGERWDLVQFHWHTPSEHEIEGRDTPLEMHLVHSRADGALMVIAVFMERGDKNRALDPMFRELPDPPDQTREVSGVRLRDLLPEGRRSFRYAGSLTTPPFTEPVKFVVLAESIELSRGQIGAFEELFEEGNSREVQPLNGRKVRSDVRRLPL
jgi:carbonic anhydrase